MIPISRGVSFARNRFFRTGEPGFPALLRTILGIPLQQKLLGANLVILGVAVFVLFGPLHLNAGRSTDVVVVVVALSVGALANFALVRLALRPITTLEHVARPVSEGRL